MDRRVVFMKRNVLRGLTFYEHHPIDSVYTIESVIETVSVIECIFVAKVARQW